MKRPKSILKNSARMLKMLPNILKVELLSIEKKSLNNTNQELRVNSIMQANKELEEMGLADFLKI